jgi:hypothetical protein
MDIEGRGATPTTLTARPPPTLPPRPPSLSEAAGLSANSSPDDNTDLTGTGDGFTHGMFRATTGLEYWDAFRERYGLAKESLSTVGAATSLQAMPEVSSIVLFGIQPGRTIALLSIGGHPGRGTGWRRRLG